MGILNVGFVGYTSDHKDVYRMALEGADLSEVDSSYFEIGSEVIRYVGSDDWLIEENPCKLKTMKKGFFENPLYLGKELLVIHASSLRKYDLTEFYYGATVNRGMIFYFWKSLRGHIGDIKKVLRDVATCNEIIPFKGFPKNLLFGMLPPSSLEDLLELKEGRVPEKMKTLE